MSLEMQFQIFRILQIQFIQLASKWRDYLYYDFDTWENELNVHYHLLFVYVDSAGVYDSARGLLAAGK